MGDPAPLNAVLTEKLAQLEQRLRGELGRQAEPAASASVSRKANARESGGRQAEPVGDADGNDGGKKGVATTAHGPHKHCYVQLAKMTTVMAIMMPMLLQVVVVTMPKLIVLLRVPGDADSILGGADSIGAVFFFEIVMYAVCGAILLGPFYF